MSLLIENLYSLPLLFFFFRMYKILTATSCLLLMTAASPLPEGAAVNPASQYKHQHQPQRREYSAPGFRPTVSYEEEDESGSSEDIDTAATQVRRPANPYVDDSYPIHNAIPIIQVRPQLRPQPVAIGLPKRPTGPPPKNFPEPEDDTEVC